MDSSVSGFNLNNPNSIYYLESLILKNIRPGAYRLENEDGAQYEIDAIIKVIYDQSNQYETLDEVQKTTLSLAVKQIEAWISGKQHFLSLKGSLEEPTNQFLSFCGKVSNVLSGNFFDRSQALNEMRWKLAEDPLFPNDILRMIFARLPLNEIMDIVPLISRAFRAHMIIPCLSSAKNSALKIYRELRKKGLEACEKPYTWVDLEVLHWNPSFCCDGVSFRGIEKKREAFPSFYIFQPISYQLTFYFELSSNVRVIRDDDKIKKKIKIKKLTKEEKIAINEVLIKFNEELERVGNLKGSKHWGYRRFPNA